ncbi:L-ascorbate oxidase homolog [Papaver somniferum]|uniref:L-ascorbate oxidase homolog n=1 Tax=Papaver somniferum TaxID=3469 RepID=UPI000E6FE73D|nr:L-ascorbate oxidase homolog [Papaver somniferum]
MRGLQLVELSLVFLGCLSSIFVKAEDPYKLFTWTVTYGNLAPLGVSQQVILINGQFPGPRLDVVTNDNMIINVINKLDEPFLLTWNGIKQRKNSWQDGVLGTNCPIPPNSNYTYKMQPKDQIGTYSYFPSTAFHKAAGGFGGINIYARPRIPVPYALPTADFTLLIGDWHRTNHKLLRNWLDSGKALPSPDGLLLNGRARSLFSGDRGKTYMFRITNIGLSTSINFRIQDHKMKLTECEGAHTVQSYYDSLDIHVGQSVSVLVTFDQPAKDYYIVASTRFTRANLTTTSVLRYTNSQVDASGPLPAAPTLLKHWSMKQARTFRWNLTANAARPNPQGSYHYGKITTSRRIILSNSAPIINGKQRYAVNGLSYVNSETPLKLADYYNITGVFTTDAIEREDNRPTLATSVLKGSLHEFVEIVFQNNENEIQSWHVDGNDFWVVGFGTLPWHGGRPKSYNLMDAATRHTVQVYPNSWTAILMSVENQGMWNIRSANWARQYLGQQFYFRVWTEIQSFRNEYDIPENALLCGKAAGRKIKRRQA